MLSGMILLWSGAIGDIPVGYHLCDGGAGTPDLRNQFVIGAGDTFAVDASGGNLQHDHGFTGNGHTHDLVGGTDVAEGVDLSLTTGPGEAVGTTDGNSQPPPYYALAFVMKL